MMHDANPGKAVSFTTAELARATSNFDPLNQISHGGFGLAYQGRLRDGSLVAIKLCEVDAHEQRQFQTQVEMLTQVHHLNVGKVIGYSENYKECLLVVEYVPNGNLRRHLERKYGEVLDMSTRLDIAIDVAHALMYLHNRSIIHGNIKSSNILLTDMYQAKVVDFGFSCMGPSTNKGADQGYLDPEYFTTYQLNTKSDVYSFGILLVEILTGRRPMELRRKSKERVTVRWAFRKFVEGKVGEMLDPKLKISLAALEILARFLELAFSCSAPKMVDRPCMKKAAEVLREIRKDFIAEHQKEKGKADRSQSFRIQSGRSGEGSYQSLPQQLPLQENAVGSSEAVSSPSRDHSMQTSDRFSSVNRVATVSYGSAPKDNVYDEIQGAVTSSSGQGGMVKRVKKSTKKVQSKDLKSGRLIGKGPSSIVYETTHEGRSYARKDFLRVPSDIFEREAAALVLLHHPNVLQIYSWTVDEGSCSLVLELMDDDLLNMMHKRVDAQRKKFSGSSSSSQRSHLIDLHKFIEGVRIAPTGTASEFAATAPLVYPFDMPEALQIMVQIAEGMKFLHDEGVAHGDLKPKNILVTSKASSLEQSVVSELKVADFGLVRTKMKSRALVSRRTRKLEMTRWRAPELFDLIGLREDVRESSSDSDWDSESTSEEFGDRVQLITFMDMARADVYNFGLTCSQILHGEDPYPDLNVDDLMNEISVSRMRPELPPTCPGQLSDLIKLCWGEKYDRPSFQDILSELKDLQASFTRIGSPMTTTTARSFAQTHSELVSRDTAVSTECSDIPRVPEGFANDHEVGVSSEIIQHGIEDFQDSPSEADSSAGPKVEGFEQRKNRQKGFSSLGTPKVWRCLSGVGSVDRMGDMNDNRSEEEDISARTKFSSWLRDKVKFGAWERRSGIVGPKLKAPQLFSSYDVKRMTNNFNYANIIGRDSWFKLYKGIQSSTGARVIVKRAGQDYCAGTQELKNEIELLWRVHHSNVVEAVGFCFERAEQLLVYNCVANGSLEDWLCGSMSGLPLDWDVRLQIALGAAKGLAYLHDHADPPIIHRDFKSFNILLDENLNAKIAHFGLSLLVLDRENSWVMAPVVGTPVYLDPEYYSTGHVSMKSDVYGFGIVLLELISGRSPKSDFSGTRTSKRLWTVKEVKERCKRDGVDIARIRELLDPALAGTRVEDLETLVTIACLCGEDRPRERPSMHEVVQRLESLVEQSQTRLTQESITLES